MSVQTRFRIAFTLALLAGLAWGCGSSDDGWETKEPAEAGFDQAALEQLTDDLRAGEYGNIHAVLIEHDGKLVYEEYFTADGFPIDHTEDATAEPIAYDAETKHELNRITQSVTSALLGAALRDAAFGPDFEAALDGPILEFLPEFEGLATEGVESITLRHALNMTARLEWRLGVNLGERSDGLRFSRSADPIAYVLTRPFEQKFPGIRDSVLPPGDRWRYNGGLTMVVAAVIRRITGEPIEDYARTTLFEPLGITDFEWIAPAAWRSHSVDATTGLWLRPRDLAKIGSVVLHDGKWGGVQVLPAEWVALSTQDQVSTDGLVFGLFGYVYGYHWWLGSFQEWTDAYDAIMGTGSGGQRLFILPEERLVVTILAADYDNLGSSFDSPSDEIMERILTMRVQ